MIFPQFATHNAHSIAAVLELAPPAARRTNFSGCTAWDGLLYAEAARQVAGIPARCGCMRPSGEHKDLLAYLVRRLLENGANTSFVNRFMDEQVPVADIVRDPITELERLDVYPHPRLPLPVALVCGPAQFTRGSTSAIRRRSRRCGPGSPAAGRREHSAGPIIGGVAASRARRHADHQSRRSPREVGYSRDATTSEIAEAFDAGERRAGGLG